MVLVPRRSKVRTISRRIRGEGEGRGGSDRPSPFFSLSSSFLFPSFPPLSTIPPWFLWCGNARRSDRQPAVIFYFYCMRGGVVNHDVVHLFSLLGPLEGSFFFLLLILLGGESGGFTGQETRNAWAAGIDRLNES